MHHLKQQLICIRENGYDYTGYDLEDLSLNMLKHIGTTDGELRDALIYTTFGDMIIAKNVLSVSQMKRLLRISLDKDHLFYGFGEKESDSVFARAFSVLVLGLILNADRRHSFLSKSEFENVKGKLFTYVAGENDIRGYVVGKGWAHALAHAADTLDEIARHPYATGVDLEELLKIIQSTFLVSETVYSYNEDERMALPVISIFKSGVVNESQILVWIREFEPLLEVHKERVSDPEGLNIDLNVRNLLHSLYFRLRFERMGTLFQKKIEETLDAIRAF